MKLVIIETLTKDEASAFIKFLESEIIRHQEDIEGARDKINLVQRKVNNLPQEHDRDLLRRLGVIR